MVKLAFYLGRKADNPKTRWFDRLVCWWTGSKFSHVELVEEYSATGPSACLSSSNRDGGVRRAQIDVNSGRWALVDVSCAPEEAIVWFEAHLGEDYDWPGLLNFIFPLDFSSRKRWICSSSCAAALGVRDPQFMCPGALEQLLSQVAYARALAAD